MKNNLMTHIVAGYPDMATSRDLLRAMDAAGVAYIEVQMPFSDPIADGPVLTQAQSASLAGGTTVQQTFALIQQMSAELKAELLVMTYFNIVHAYGLEKFCKKAASLGLYGLIVPDIPLDEETTEGFLATCKKYDLHAVQIVAPTTPEERLKKIATVASGMLYCVSRAGTTGARRDLPKETAQYLKRVRKHTALPLALGFGISQRSQVDAALQHADIAVVGSGLLEVVNTTPKAKRATAVKKYITELVG